MKCPACEKQVTALVTETRTDEEGTVFRRRYCGHCGTYFVTRETPVLGLKMPPQTRQPPKKSQRY